jgi:hypothetical protein
MFLRNARALPTLPHTEVIAIVARTGAAGIWLGWAHLAKKRPETATTPIATGLLHRLPEKVSFSIF